MGRFRSGPAGARSLLCRGSTDLAIIHVAVIQDFRSPSGCRLGFFGLDFGPVLGPSGPQQAQNQTRRGPNNPQKITGSLKLQPRGIMATSVHLRLNSEVLPEPHFVSGLVFVCFWGSKLPFPSQKASAQVGGEARTCDGFSGEKRPFRPQTTHETRPRNHSLIPGGFWI